MNYIKRLENENKEVRVELCGLRCGLSDLKSYLQSSKFWNDTTVQVNDVLLRLEEAERKSMDLLNDQVRIHNQ